MGKDIPSIHDRSIGTETEARFASMLETAMDGIIVFDEKARILVFNRVSEQLFGYRFHEVIGLSVDAILPPDLVERHLNDTRRINGTLLGADGDLSCRHKDGSLIPVEMSIGESYAPAGRQLIAILRDIRPRKAVEERLNQLQAQVVHMARVNAMNEMGGAIAHELNQPLTAVVLYLQTILRKLPSNDASTVNNKMTEILNKAVGEAKRAGNIILSMRQFIEKREPERKLIDMQRLIGDAVELTRLGSHAEDVQFECTGEDKIPEVLADSVQIQQILVNLIRNGVEATRQTDVHRIQITTSADAASVFVDVQDSGPGIPLSAMDGLFKAFSSSKGNGLGLGLAISRTIAQNHGGDLTAIAGGNGSGARFTLKLPRAPAPGE